MSPKPTATHIPNTNLHSVLDDLIALTSETDSSALALTLAETLLTLADVKGMSMFSAGSINRAKYEMTYTKAVTNSQSIPVYLLNDLTQCLEAAQINHLEHQGKKLTLFPVMCLKTQPVAVIVVEETTDTSNQQLVVQILNIYQNFLALMNENERDTLTGLRNRKTFDQKINSIIATLLNNDHAQSDGQTSYLAIFDIDHFKQVNDNYGHSIGDEVLLLFSRLMENSFRSEDMLYRFGGEEFVGIFSCASDEAISSILNRFRKAIAAHPFPQVGHISVSCGYTKVAQADQAANIIDRADLALYHAKNNGRNQVHSHETLVAEGILPAHIGHASGEIELF